MGALVFVNGRIHTMDPSDRIVDGLLVEGERIVLAGAAEVVRAAAPPDAAIVDLDGRTMVPGFIDAHDHLAFTGAELGQVDVRYPAVGSIAELVARIAQVAERTADGVPLRAVGMNHAKFTEGRLPTRWDLDEATRVHPVIIQHISGHHALANSLALARRGLTDDTPDPEGGLHDISKHRDCHSSTNRRWKPPLRVTAVGNHEGQHTPSVVAAST